MNGANKLVCGFEGGLSGHEHRGLSESPRHLVELAKATEGSSFSGHRRIQAYYYYYSLSLTQSTNRNTHEIRLEYSY